VNIPISALAGDNVVNRTARMPWYTGPTLIQHLETVPPRVAVRHEAVRFPVQYVVRPNAEFRGFAGQVASGTIRPGAEVLALPSREKTRVRSIVTHDGDEAEAFAPMSVTLTLEKEIDLSRGDMLVTPEEPPHVSRNFQAMVVWFHAEPLVLARNYLIKHNVRTSRAKATKIGYRVDMQTLDQDPANELKMNDIGEVEFEAASPLYFDSYDRNRITGSFILIDPLSNATVGAGMIRGELPETAAGQFVGEAAEAGKAGVAAPVAAEERFEWHGHYPALVVVAGRPRLAENVERALFAQGMEVVLLSTSNMPADSLEAVLKVSRAAGLVVILSTPSGETADTDRWKAMAGDGFFDLAALDLPADDAQAVAPVLALLRSLRTERSRNHPRNIE